MRTLEAVPVDPPFKIKDVPVKQNPTPKATDEKGNPKHWVRKRIEVRAGLSVHTWCSQERCGSIIGRGRLRVNRCCPSCYQKQRSLSGLQPAESESPRKAVNQGPPDSLLTPTESGKRSMPGSGRDDVLSPSRISGLLPGTATAEGAGDSGHGVMLRLVTLLLPDLVDEEWLVQCTGTSNLQEVSWPACAVLYACGRGCACNGWGPRALL